MIPWVGPTGLLGLAAMSGLFPIAVILPAALRTRPKATGSEPPHSLEILIPAHNEERSLPATLDALARERNDYRSRAGKVPISVHVGADACSDRTAQIAHQAGAQVDAYSFRSKWRTLDALVRSSTHAERDGWIALVDADVLWPERLLTSFLTTAWPSDVIAVAPSFGKGVLWKLESFLKRIENRAGGPVSVHGATVFYRKTALIAATRGLSDREPSCRGWLNDDVVIPLWLRSRYPELKIRYWIPPSGSLRENTARDARAETLPQRFRRRLRMTRGNLQWIILLLPWSIARNPLAGALALRRAFRVFWADWIIMVLLGFFGPSEHLWVIAISSLSVFLISRDLFAAWIVSLFAPIAAISETPWN